jgi:hypothetical protein
MKGDENRVPQLSRKPVTGSYHPKEALAPDQHHLGWNGALSNALKRIGRDRGDYQVHIEFSAVVHVENPGHIIEYQVTLI